MKLIKEEELNKIIFQQVYKNKFKEIKIIHFQLITVNLKKNNLLFQF